MRPLRSPETLHAGGNGAGGNDDTLGRLLLEASDLLGPTADGGAIQTFARIGQYRAADLDDAAARALQAFASRGVRRGHLPGFLFQFRQPLEPIIHQLDAAVAVDGGNRILSFILTKAFFQSLRARL